MDKKIYIITIKESGKLASIDEAYSTLDNAVKRIKNTCKPNGYQLRETELKNEFQLYTHAEEFVHTLRIVDLWVR
jgi:hypothetical protein